ncbi:MAG: transcriptional repressor LexA [Gemmataceae bacterium]|jgi:repressor LexA|nr:transcriptional repressor LexA [Gemmataceae bacterium]
MAGRNPPLTETQAKVFEYILDSIKNRGFAPSIRDICHEFNWDSPNGAICHLKALERKGYIVRPKDERIPGKKIARGIVIPSHIGRKPQSSEGSVTFPVYGVVAAGPAIEAIPTEETADLGEMLGGDEHYALRVKGNSMIEDHIKDGDLVIIKPQSTAHNGERVVAMVDGSVTLKKFYQRRDRIILEPANSTMPPIEVGPDRDIKILGKLVGVVRRS